MRSESFVTASCVRRDTRPARRSAQRTTAGGEGYPYRGQTVFESLFGGEEVVVIMERDDDVPLIQYDFLLLATSQTSTLQTELAAAGQRGFELAGLTVGSTAFGGDIEPSEAEEVCALGPLVDARNTPSERSGRFSRSLTIRR